MYKKPIARALSRSIPPHDYTPLFQPVGHVNVGTIGTGLHEELMQELAIDSVVRKALDHNHAEFQKQLIGNASFETTGDNSFNMNFDIDMLKHQIDLMEQARQRHLDVTCEVPEELRSMFLSRGMTEEDVDRVILYPNRCEIVNNAVNIVYKMQPKDGL